MTIDCWSAFAIDKGTAVAGSKRKNKIPFIVLAALLDGALLGVSFWQMRVRA